MEPVRRPPTPPRPSREALEAVDPRRQGQPDDDDDVVVVSVDGFEGAEWKSLASNRPEVSLTRTQSLIGKA